MVDVGLFHEWCDFMDSNGFTLPTSRFCSWLVIGYDASAFPMTVWLFTVAETW